MVSSLHSSDVGGLGLHRMRAALYQCVFIAMLFLSTFLLVHRWALIRGWGGWVVVCL